MGKKLDDLDMERLIERPGEKVPGGALVEAGSGRPRPSRLLADI